MITKTIFRLCLKHEFFNGAKPFRKRFLFPSSGRQNIYKPRSCLDFRVNHSDTSDSHRVSNKVKVKVKSSRYRPGVAHRVGRGIALLFHDRGTRRGEWSAVRPGRTLPPGETRYPVPVWTGGKSRPHWASIPDRPTHIQSLYRLSYPAYRIHTKLKHN